MYQTGEVGARLKKLRCDGKYSRRYIAEHIGRSVKYYADIERGSCGMSVDTLLALAEFYGVSLDYLVNGTEVETEVTDLQVKWAIRHISQMEESRRRAVLDMLKLIEK